MVDVQNLADERNINIKKVGVKGIKYPILVLDRANGVQHVNATINMYVNLPHHFKGTHMSRFIEILNEYRGKINIKTFKTIPGKSKRKTRRRIGAHGDRISLFHRKDRSCLRGKKPHGICRAASAVRTGARKRISWSA